MAVTHVVDRKRDSELHGVTFPDPLGFCGEGSGPAVAPTRKPDVAPARPDVEPEREPNTVPRREPVR